MSDTTRDRAAGAAEGARGRGRGRGQKRGQDRGRSRSKQAGPLRREMSRYWYAWAMVTPVVVVTAVLIG
ncbi:hypothetical protein ACFFMN_21715, partial [Planobispora siamensis]